MFSSSSALYFDSFQTNTTEIPHTLISDGYKLVVLISFSHVEVVSMEDTQLPFRTGIAGSVPVRVGHAHMDRKELGSLV